jgi:protein-tyrosine phosphatase
MDNENLRALQARKPNSSKAQLGLFLDYAEHAGSREVPDPYGGDADDFERVLDLITLGARGLIADLKKSA